MDWNYTQKFTSEQEWALMSRKFVFNNMQVKSFAVSNSEHYLIILFFTMLHAY